MGLFRTGARGRSLALWAACCLAVTAETAASPAARAVTIEEVMREATEQIRSAYVDPVPLERLLVVGLGGVAQAGIPLDAGQRRTLAAVTAAVTAEPENARRMSAFLAVLNDVARRAGPKAGGPLTLAVLRAMMSGLDPRSEYLPPADPGPAQRTGQAPSGSVGLELTQFDGAVTVVRPLPDGPASRSKIRSADVLLAIDGRPVSDSLTLTDVMARLRGPLGSTVALTVRRPGVGEPLTITMSREVVGSLRLRWALVGRIAYIRPEVFLSQTQADLRVALASATGRAGAPLEGIVLDLRDNSGGLLDVAAAVAAGFLPDGGVVSLRGRTAQDNRPVAASGDVVPGTPIAVLVNERTAAGAEIVAGALQERGRAVLLGSPTYGYGTIQTAVPLTSTGGIMKITSARLHLPSGRAFEGSGVTPDIAVRPAESSMSARLAATRHGARAPLAPRPDRPDLAPLRDRIAATPPTGDPPPDPLEPQADFEVRQAIRLLGLLQPSPPRP